VAAVDLDFLRTRRPAPMLAWLLLAIGAGLLALVASRYASEREAHALAVEQAERLAQLQEAVAPRKAAASARRAAGPTDAELLDLDWGRLLTDLEATRPDHIAFVALRGDGRKRQAVIQAEARTASRMLDYLDVLRAQPGFSEVTLTSHLTEEDEPLQPLRFEARLNWGRP
jgi:Tfp pilus assembly protein PilN